MPKTDTSKAADAFIRCVSEMRANLGLWPELTREFKENVETTTLAIMSCGGRKKIATKLKTVAGIIAAMHKNSVNRKARMIACDALIQLDTFAWTACDRHAANAHRLEEIVAQDAKDRGVRTPKRAMIETRSPVFA